MVYKKRAPTTSGSKPSSKSGKFQKKDSTKSNRYSSDSRVSKSSPRAEKLEKKDTTKSDRNASDRRISKSDRYSSDKKPSKFNKYTTNTKSEHTEKRDFSTEKNHLMNERPQRPEKRDSPTLRTKKGLPKEIFIWGRRTVEAFFENLHQQAKDLDGSKYALHIIVDKTHKAPSQLKPSVESAKLLGIKVVPHVSAEETWPLADASEELNHQRICLKVPEYPVQNIVDATRHVKAANENSQHGCVGIVLDQIQDPRNFGAIIRSAAFFGVKFVVYGTDRQADISSLVLKTSAGGAFSVSLIPAVNINRSLQQLKEAGAWIAGAALSENATSISAVPSDRTWIAVLGNEGKGLRNEVLKNCDYIVQIPGGQGTVDSLNVSVAAGIMIHSLSK